MPALDTSRLPPQAMQMLQQQQGAGADIGDMLQQLMAMSPEEVATVLQQMGIQVTPEQVQSAAENWVDQAADSASGSSSPDDETAETTPDSESAEGEAAPQQASNLEGAEAAAGEQPSAEGDEGESEGESELPPNAQPTGYQGAGGSAAAAMAAMQGGGAMPRGVPVGPPGVGGGAGAGAMDDLISAQMMQRAVGNPNATVPTPGGGVPMPRSASAIPNPRPSGAADNTRMKAMIADVYRNTGGKGGRKPATPSARPR